MEAGYLGVEDGPRKDLAYALVVEEQKELLHKALSSVEAQVNDALADEEREELLPGAPSFVEAQLSDALQPPQLQGRLQQGLPKKCPDLEMEKKKELKTYLTSSFLKIALKKYWDQRLFSLASC